MKVAEICQKDRTKTYVRLRWFPILFDPSRDIPSVLYRHRMFTSMMDTFITYEDFRFGNSGLYDGHRGKEGKYEKEFHDAAVAILEIFVGGDCEMSLCYLLMMMVLSW